MEELKFKWLPTECASEKYPMQILKGSFLLEDASTVKIPDKRYIGNGWGETGSIHLVGDEIKPIPIGIEILWFSYTEQKFYKGNFDLPKNEITQLFSNGFISPIDNKNTTYSYLLVGLAPNGGIAIWAKGDRITKEICYLKGKETFEVDIDNFVGSCKTISNFVNMNLEETFSKEDILALNKNGVPNSLWDSIYRKQYNCNVNLINIGDLESISIGYFNGEREYFDLESIKNEIKTKLTIPKDFYIKWISSNGTNFGSEVFFDEQEIIAAFSKINESPLTKDLILQVELSEVNESLKIYLRNDKYILELKKCDVKTYKK